MRGSRIPILKNFRKRTSANSLYDLSAASIKANTQRWIKGNTASSPLRVLVLTAHGKSWSVKWVAMGGNDGFVMAASWLGMPSISSFTSSCVAAIHERSR
jgi:hypothetical protein